MPSTRRRPNARDIKQFNSIFKIDMKFLKTCAQNLSAGVNLPKSEEDPSCSVLCSLSLEKVFDPEASAARWLQGINSSQHSNDWQYATCVDQLPFAVPHERIVCTATRFLQSFSWRGPSLESPSQEDGGGQQVRMLSWPAKNSRCSAKTPSGQFSQPPRIVRIPGTMSHKLYPVINIIHHSPPAERRRKGRRTSRGCEQELIPSRRASAGHST